MKIGLIVNPIAGLGGSAGLKGSDDPDIPARALALGAVPHAEDRAVTALEPLRAVMETFSLVAAPSAMGENAALRLGFSPQVCSGRQSGVTTAEDTIHAARAMQAGGVGLFLFAGGDGTARDIARAVGMELPVLGIPAGVKIQSAVFAVNPRSAGELAAAFLRGAAGLKDAEVVDLDEEAYRSGSIATRLYGFLRIPYQATRVQERKAPTPAGEAVQMAAIAAAVVEDMQPGWIYILGPGTTTRAIADQLGFQKTLVGVDIVRGGVPVLLDVTEKQILHLLEKQAPAQAKIIVTPIGGQGFLFGRGSQQISPAVIRHVGRENIQVISLPGKLAALRGRPLLVDTGEPEVDRMLAGYYNVITGYRERTIYRVDG